MIITIHQPEYLPWLGFFDRIYQADTFVVLDDVGYQKNGFVNRNKIKTADGWQWLTVPVKGRSPNKKINEVSIDNQKDWRNSQWKILCQNYAKAPCFKTYANFLEDTFKKEWILISDLDIYLIKNIVKMLGLRKRIEKISNYSVKGTATERLVNICKKFNADVYLSGPAGKNYMDLSLFEQAGIRVIFQQFSHPKYQQQFMTKGFLPGLSIIDLLFNYGKKSANIIKGIR